MHMTYASDTGEVLVIWNSRDGVTPFGCAHPETGASLTHVRWNEDRYDPNHVPAVGDWIWVDLHDENAMAKAVAFVERWWDDHDMPMREHGHFNPDGADGPEAKMRAARIYWESVTQADAAERGPEPDLVQVTEPMRDAFEHRVEEHA